MNFKILSSITLALLLIFSISGQMYGQEEEYGPWPIPEEIETGMLPVSDVHTLYYEVAGNPDGIPVFMLHGGPGVGSSRGYFSFADPEKCRIIVFDQRGSGKSTPYASIEENTTAHLVEDINKLREHLGIEKPAILWGVSWGSTLALAYAEEYPELTAGLVLVSTFTGLKWEIDHIYHGGAGVNYPEMYAWMMELVDDKTGNVPAQYYAMITGDDEELSKEAAMRIAAFEVAMIQVNITPEQAKAAAANPQFFSFGKISTYYMMNHCFLIEGELLRGADAIVDLPIYFVSGRVDPVTPPKSTYDFIQQLNNATWYVSPGESHNDAGVFTLARRSMTELLDSLSGGAK